VISKSFARIMNMVYTVCPYLLYSLHTFVVAQSL